MPTLFHGLHGKDKKPRLYGIHMQPIEAPQVFKHFLPKATGRLAPKDSRSYVARVWWFVDHKTTALSWLDPVGNEQTVFINGLHKTVQAVMIARAEFPDVIPGPLMFRVKRKVKEV
jgi:hypothetical protein